MLDVARSHQACANLPCASSMAIGVKQVAISIVARAAVITSSEAKRVIWFLTSSDCSNIAMPAAEKASTFSGTMRANSARSAAIGLTTAANPKLTRFAIICPEPIARSFPLSAVRVAKASTSLIGPPVSFEVIGFSCPRKHSAVPFKMCFRGESFVTDETAWQTIGLSEARQSRLHAMIRKDDPATLGRRRLHGPDLVSTEPYCQNCPTQEVFSYSRLAGPCAL